MIEASTLQAESGTLVRFLVWLSPAWSPNKRAESFVEGVRVMLEGDEATPFVVSVLGEVGPAPVRVGFCGGGSGR